MAGWHASAPHNWSIRPARRGCPDPGTDSPTRRVGTLGNPAGKRIGHPLRAALVDLSTSQTMQWLQALPPEQREPALRGRRQRYRSWPKTWRPAFRDPAAPTWREQAATLMRQEPRSLGNS